MGITNIAFGGQRFRNSLVVLEIVTDGQENDVCIATEGVIVLSGAFGLFKEIIEQRGSFFSLFLCKRGGVEVVWQALYQLHFHEKIAKSGKDLFINFV